MAILQDKACLTGSPVSLCDPELTELKGKHSYSNNIRDYQELVNDNGLEEAEVTDSDPARWMCKGWQCERARQHDGRVG